MHAKRMVSVARTGGLVCCPSWLIDVVVDSRIDRGAGTTVDRNSRMLGRACAHAGLGFPEPGNRGRGERRPYQPCDGRAGGGVCQPLAGSGSDPWRVGAVAV